MGNQNEDPRVQEIADFLNGERKEIPANSYNNQNEDVNKEKNSQMEESVRHIADQLRELGANVQALGEENEKLQSALSGLKSRLEDIAKEKNTLSPSEIESLVEEIVSKKADIAKRDHSIDESNTGSEKNNEEEEYETIGHPVSPDDLEKLADRTNDDEELEEYQRGSEEEKMIGEEKPVSKNKKRGILKVLAYSFLSILVLLAIVVAGYIYTKKRHQGETAPVAETQNSAMITYTPKEKVKQQPVATRENIIDAEKANKAGKEDYTPKREREKAKNVKATTPQSAQSKMNMTPPPPPTEENTVSLNQQVSPRTEKSPIEKELLGDTQQEDIAFACRLKAKYPSGEYIYYVKDGTDYVPNKEDATVSIGERNIVYNYSPDNTFVKIDENKYLKSKIFTQCAAVKGI